MLSEGVLLSSPSGTPELEMEAIMMTIFQKLSVKKKDGRVHLGNHGPSELLVG